MLIDSKQQLLQQAYRQLTAVQKSIVQIFALLGGPTNRERARLCWNEAMQRERKPAEGKLYPKLHLLEGPQFGEEVRLLLSRGLLSQQRTEGPRCHTLLVEIALRDAVMLGTFDPMAQAIEERLPIRTHYQSSRRDFWNPSEFMRSLRMAIYREDTEDIETLFSEISHVPWRAEIDFYSVLRDILTHPFDADWMRNLSDAFQEMGLSAILENSAERCTAATEAFDLLAEIYETQEISLELSLLYAEQLWLRGCIDEAKEVLTDIEGIEEAADYVPQYEGLQGAIAFLTGDTQAAIAHYRRGIQAASIQAAGNTAATQIAWFEYPASLLFFFALLESGQPAAQQEAEKYAVLIQQSSDHWLKNSMPLLLSVLHMQQGHLSSVISAVQQFKHYRIGTVGLPALIEMYSLYWLSIDNTAILCKQLSELCQIALDAGYSWIALETAELLVSFQPDSIYAEVVETLREQADSLPLIDIIEKKDPWELSLNALVGLTQKASLAPAAAQDSTYRLAWRLRFNGVSHWALTPIEQKIGAKGDWTKGKPIALKRLYSAQDIPDYASEQDRRICATLKIQYHQPSSYYYRSAQPVYYFTNRALLALAGHPLVCWENSPAVRVEVVAGEPELLVKRLEGDRLSIELSPPVKDADLLAFKETPTRLKVIPITADHQRIAEILGPNNRLEVPAAAEERVLQAIASVASLVTVQSDIGGGVEAEEVPADARIRVHLLPAGEGLKVSLLAHPFPEGGSYYPPGQGGETVIAEVEGKRLQTKRDLVAERENAQTVIITCPILSKLADIENDEWLIDEPSDCLELLLQLQALGDSVTIEWPEGEKFKVSRRLSTSDFKFDIRRQQDWFAASGEVQISESHVMDLRQLMALLENSSGPFVPLANGEFLALTDEFRQRLNTLSRLSQPHGKELRIHGLAALALDEMLEDVEQLAVDQAWRDHIARIQAAREIEPEVPQGLQAKLRSYQCEGYTWLARLANWGVGACLADDMGLGKTLQGLALILSRCQEGPTLVLAPTSVCMNWASEAERFAPSLEVKDFGTGDRTDRQQLLDGLGANDLLVCSYGLIQQADVAAMLAGISWQNIVLDEAQAIKNHATKRSGAVMALQGNFKIIMTGTPIENHLGELWNLFRFINPGLLGSLDSFNLRFANPIERDQDESASDTLRRLIQPFILRRTKDQVLKELPSRTEITLPVELSTEEMAFYEALRQEALEKLNDSEAQAGQKHLQVLAEIMKLRRACCNPSLVKPELAIASTKLEQFSELIAELLDNGHKALVFSQFVDHLKILREHLDQQQIVYQYLDGSTPAKKRKQSVDDFQQGKGDIFLISLKAGGTGLNLTAADYVIHMDPWWNPAVEDQASDRAHRIGQQRPVTIYRLVAKGTIEDKIVALHQVKRDLADSLLTGTDMSSKISTEQLLSLIQQ